MIDVLKRFSLFFAFLFLIGSIWEAHMFFAEKEFNYKAFLEKSSEDSSKLALMIEKISSNVKKIAKDLTDEINTGEIPQRLILQRLQEALARNQQLYGIGAFFHPLSNDPGQRHKTPFYINRFPDGKFEDHELIEVARIPISYTDSSGNLLTCGFVCADLSRKKIIEALNEVKLGRNGFVYIVSGDGKYLAHPREELIIKKKTLFQEAIETGSPALKNLAIEIANGNKGNITVRSRKTGGELITFFHPVQSTGWSVISAYLGEPLKKPTISMQRRLFRLIVELAFCLTFIFLYRTFRMKTVDESKLWIYSTAISLIFTTGIFAMWFFTLNFREFLEDNDTPVSDPSVLEHFKEKYSRDIKRTAKVQPKFIPIGISLQSIEFQSAVNVKLSGVVWQRVPASASEEIPEGVVFPESVETVLEKIYDRDEGKEKIIGWRFQVVIREPFEYRTFPFDLGNIWLRMIPANYDTTSLLVPDFQAYETLNPKLKPGLDSEIFIPNWSIKESYFSYFPISYNINFGLKQRSGQEIVPELYFNVVIQRNFLGPFISSLLPLFVVVILVFSVLLIHTKDEQRMMLFGFNSGVTIQVAAALFFVIIYAQIDLRSRLEVESIMYMDFFYFLTYLIFLVTSVDSIFFCWTNRFQWLQYGENLLPKLMYWPLTTFCIFCVTINYFYP
ncbi:MAG: Cache 3/Cache 2 fusion domain-containing protein [Candidatus Riflebacteria bacterium]|nr:Cache 3/Cache 2 fusion domain-containing protein [Candidatus Riflebacteria bacterium]